jgi:hypothetical protein
MTPNEEDRSPEELMDLLRRQPGDSLRGPPSIESFSPSEGPPGTLVEITGENLLGSRILIGSVRARVIDGHRNGVVVEVPAIEGEHSIEAENVFGYAISADLFKVVVKPNRYTFRGDAISFGGQGHSIAPTGKDQPFLALICQPSGMALPAGHTAATLLADLDKKLRGTNNSANTFWLESSYGKTSFKFDIHNSVLKLPSKLSAYYQQAQPKRITGSGATYPVTWSGGETLNIRGDSGFTAPVKFLASSMGLNKVVKAINLVLQLSSADPTKPPIRALASGGQLQLETTRKSATAILEITDGTARTALGLTSGKVTVTPGLNHVDEDIKMINDALKARTAGMSDQEIKTFVGKYDGVIVALTSNTTTALMRAQADVEWWFNFGKKEQFKGSWVAITTGYPWQVYAHEIGHTLGFPDLYDDSGLQAGVGKGYTGKPWMEDTDIEEIKAPLQTKTWDVLLAPVERPLPASNPFATSHPNAPLRQAIRIVLSPELSYYVENRQKPFKSSTFGTSKYDAKIPAEGVIITNAADRDKSKLFRVFVTMATPYSNTLDTLGETWTYYVNPTNRIQVKVIEALGTDPTVYRIQVTWGDIPPATGTSFDFRIRDWNPPPWESPDIWVDTKVDNDWGVYKHSDAKKNPNVAGNPILNGDRLRANWESRLYARVWNDGNVEKKNVKVKFQVVIPSAMGPSPGLDIGDVTVDLPAGGSAVTPPVKWAPMSDKEKHMCIRAFVVPDPGEKDYKNNLAQENFTDWYIKSGSAYQPIQFPFQVTNPLPRRALVLMRPHGLVPGFNLTVEPYRFWLEPDETIRGQAVLEAEDWVMLEDAMHDEGMEPPVVGLEAWVKRGCTYVPFGGVSGIAHTVRTATLEMAADPSGERVIVSGRATTAAGSISRANVTARLLEADGITEMALARVVTDQNGAYQIELTPSKSPVPGEWYLVEGVLSPTLGTGPADAGPIRVQFS